MYSWLWELYAVISFLVFLWVNEERCSLPVQRATSDKPRNWVRGVVVFTCCGGQAVCTHAGLFPIEIWVGITQEHSSALSHHQAQPPHKENGSSERPAWPRLLQNLLELGSPGGECQLWHGPGNKAWGVGFLVHMFLIVSCPFFFFFWG